MNTIVAQCGGPTPVINASLAAIVRAWQQHGSGRIYGARYGLEGLSHGDWVDLHGLDESALAALAMQPSAALGGSRHRPSEAEIVRIARHEHRAPAPTDSPPDRLVLHQAFLI